MKTLNQVWNELLEQNDEFVKRFKTELEAKIKKEVDFESYLMEKFTEEEPTVLDDDIPDRFNDWLEQIDIQTIIDCGQGYAEKIYKGRVK